jgi:hypothetical protein
MTDDTLNDTITALNQIERIEDDLHARDDPMADDVSDLRRVAGRMLMNEALGEMDLYEDER